jgi:4-hydroxy-tetrahydrodipicolinate synthase
MNLQERLRGTGVALVTPFKNGKIDWEDLERIIGHVTEGGVEFLVSLGTTGESAVLSDSEQREILDFTIKVNKGRLPMLVGAFGMANTAAMTERIRNFNFEGIDALLASSPAYVKPSQEGIFQHFMAMEEVSPLPIVLYNVPARTSSNINAETILRLAYASKKFIGVKESSNDIYQAMKVLKGRPDHFLVLSGDDFFSLPIIAAGGDGVISVIANALPRPFTDMVRAALQYDLPVAQKLNARLLDLYRLLFVEGNPVGIKAALELKGLCSREVRLPLSPMTEYSVNLIREEMEDMF